MVNTHKILMNQYKKYYNHFIENSYNVEEIQTKKLLEILRKNKRSEFGQKHSFSSIKTIEQFQRNIPTETYEGYKKYINKISLKRQAVLTSEKITLFEPTSGSTSNSKLIPYTDGLRTEFLAGIAPWIYSIHKNYPQAMIGKQYWSITPIVNSEKPNFKSGIKIGFEDDGFYLGTDNERNNNMFIVPIEIKYVFDFRSFKYLTHLFLLKEKSLSLISIWNPSMMQVLFEDIKADMLSLCKDIAKGTFNDSLIIPKNIKLKLLRQFSADKKRAEELLNIYEKYKDTSIFFHKIFPNLKIISCWTNGNARLSMDFIKNNFSKSIVQGKGLIATECIVSIPINKLKFPAVSILSHFFEFLELDEDLSPTGKILLTHQLELNKQYCVIVTTSGGLYRYNLNDIISVKGYFNQIPLIEFIGKLDNVSDIVGEKLHETYVKNSIVKILKKYDLKPKFIMLAPEKENNNIFYVMFIESKTHDTLKLEIEKELSKNYHYSYCRKIGQLKPLKVFIIKSNGARDYIKHKASMIKLGDIKLSYLSKEFGWSQVFEGSYSR